MNGKHVYQVPYQKDKRMKATVTGVLGIGTCRSSGKERKRAQCARSDVKDLTRVRIQTVLSSSNMGRPIPPSLRKIETATWSVKVVEDAPSLFLV